MRTIDADALIEDLEYDVELDARQLDDMDFVGIEREHVQFDKDCKQNAIDLLQHAPTIEERKWIPCGERLPEEHESIWAKAKGTDRWSEAMWEKQSDEVIVTELFEDGTTRTDTACTHDGEWYVRVKTVKRKIIAWMPLPEPYEERREE